MCGGQEAELLHSDKRSVTEWQRAKVEKEHLNSKLQESPSKQKTQTLYSQFGKLITLDVNCFVGARTASVSLYLPYYKPAMTDTQAGPEAYSLMKLPIC